MRNLLLFSLLFAALGLAGCAANGDPPNGSNVPGGPGEGPASGPAPSIEARDVAILVVEQTANSIRVTSSARRPRSALGPSASWNGKGTATHTWRLIGPHQETLAQGDIVARGGSLEAPPNEGQGTPAVNVPQAEIAFTVKVPQPAPGEAIEIAPVGSNLVARWP